MGVVTVSVDRQVWPIVRSQDARLAAVGSGGVNPTTWTLSLDFDRYPGDPTPPYTISSFTFSGPDAASRYTITAALPSAVTVSGGALSAKEYFVRLWRTNAGFRTPLASGRLLIADD